ncbi:hypothetical protein V8C42DRAFT_306782 [Trichoderma barbatum]
MKESTWEGASATTTNSGDDCLTPTSSIMSEPAKLEPAIIKDDKSSTLAIRSVEHHPKDKKAVMIRERQEPRRMIALLSGQVRLMDPKYMTYGVGWQWICVKKNGWYVFRNTASGTCLGHNGQNKIYAVDKPWKTSQFFMVERHNDGGYIPLMRHGEELWQIAVSEDGTSLVELAPDKGTGTAWEFIEFEED